MAALRDGLHPDTEPVVEEEHGCPRCGSASGDPVELWDSGEYTFDVACSECLQPRAYDTVPGASMCWDEEEDIKW